MLCRNFLQRHRLQLSRQLSAIVVIAVISIRRRVSSDKSRVRVASQDAHAAAWHVGGRFTIPIGASIIVALCTQGGPVPPG